MSVLGKTPYITTIVSDMKTHGMLGTMQGLINSSSDPEFFDLTHIGGSDYPSYSKQGYSCHYATVKLDKALTLTGYLYIGYDYQTLFAFNEGGENMTIVDMHAENKKEYYNIIEEDLDINEFRRELSGISGTSSGLYKHTLTYTNIDYKFVVISTQKEAFTSGYDLEGHHFGYAIYTSDNTLYGIITQFTHTGSAYIFTKIVVYKFATFDTTGINVGAAMGMVTDPASDTVEEL